MIFSKKIGIWLLAIWLILNGLIPLLDFSFKNMNVVLGILALAAGIAILLDR